MFSASTVQEVKGFQKEICLDLLCASVEASDVFSGLASILHSEHALS